MLGSFGVFVGVGFGVLGVFGSFAFLLVYLSCVILLWIERFGLR